jgi:hypothetical protein
MKFEESDELSFFEEEFLSKKFEDLLTPLFLLFICF